MVIDKSFTYDQPSKYTLLNSSQPATNLGVDTESSWNSRPPKLESTNSFISGKDLARQSDSYMVVSHAPIESKPSPKNTKNIVKWSRIILLAFRICSWIGVAGILACVSCIQTTGTAMDWFMRVPPPVALIHLTYAIYHLSRPIRTRNLTSSASYMICAAILDSCLIPFQVLLVILAHNQLSGILDYGTQPWTTILGTEFQNHIVIYSTFLASAVTGGLLLASFCVCIFLAKQFRQIARLPPYMNPLEGNLTTRRHQKAHPSISTITSDGPHKEIATSLNIMAPSIANPDPSMISSQSQTTLDVDLQDGRQHFPKRSRPTPLRATGPTYSALSGSAGEWNNNPPTPPDSPPNIPPEFQHLRYHNHEGKKMKSGQFLSRSKYDFTNRSPRPLGLHPPTPCQETYNGVKAFDGRALRNIDGNSSARKLSNPTWEDVELDVDSENYPPDHTNNQKHYGDIVGMGRVIRNQARVVSSGMNNMQRGMEVRMREVSGKIAEEGRAGFIYTDF